MKVKRKNKINTEGMPVAYSQPVDLSATFGEPQTLLLDSTFQIKQPRNLKLQRLI